MFLCFLYGSIIFMELVFYRKTVKMNMEKLTEKDLLELKEGMISALNDIEENIITFALSDSDAEFDFLIKKAIYYRDLLKKIEQLISNY
jgi:hypothetical protein